MEYLMAFDISWLIDKRVAYMRMIGNIEIEEIKQMSEAFRIYRDEGIAPVHIIVDTREMTKMPMSFDKIKDASAGREQTKGWTVILTKSSVTRFVATLVTATISLQYRFMESPEAALTYLSQLSPELKELPVNDVMLQH
jgi:hypothetical protein